MSRIANDGFFEQISTAFKAGDPGIATKEREAGHVRCIQLMYHAIARDAFEECLELATDDFVLEILGPTGSPFNGRWQGKPEVHAAMMRNFAAVTDQQPEVESVVAQGDTVIVIVRETGRMTSSGAPYDVHCVQQFTFGNGKLRLLREFIDGGANWNTGD